MNIQSEVLQFLKKKIPKLCVLTTCSADGKPECAVMGYAVRDDLSLILSTDKTSRKWNNLHDNPRVALVFGWSFKELNIQYEGTAQLVESGEPFHQAEKIYFAAHPEAQEFKGLPETVFIKITPTWIRLSDYSVAPPRIQES